MKISALKFPPLKAKKLPESLIYESGDTIRLFSTKTGKTQGIMIARPDFVTESGVYPRLKNFWAYYIVGLEAKERGKGVGKTLEKYVREKAKADPRCKGRIYLRAFNNIDANHRASSTWWHARGYKGCDKLAQADLERVLKGQRTKYGDWYMDMDMYLPVEKIK